MRKNNGLIVGGVMVVVVLAGSVFAQEGPALAGGASPGNDVRLIEPSPGRPVFLQPGRSLYCVLAIPREMLQQVTFTLLHSVNPQVSHSLLKTTPMTPVQDKFGAIVLKVPENVTAGLYDMEVTSPLGKHVSKHVISVLAEPKSKFRFVHLSDMNVGDITAARFDMNLVEEINLLAPEFIVATGDFLEWAQRFDDTSAWKRILAYLTRFNAPVFVVCGDLDHQGTFSEYVANSPVGTFDYGRVHGLLLLDNPTSRLDAEQIKWVMTDLAEHRDGAFSMLITHNEDLSLLDMLRRRGDATDFVRKNKLKVVITGGHTDWDYVEYADKLSGLENDLHYIRTHEASTCVSGGASGVSHYRVIEVDGDEINYVYPDESASVRRQHSIPSGRLRITYDRRNDGSSHAVTATVQNGLNQSFDDCVVWIRLAKATGGSSNPTVVGGRLLQKLEVADHVLCKIGVDVPDESALKIYAATQGPPVPLQPLTVALDGDRNLTFAEQVSPHGIKRYASSQKLVVKLTNSSPKPAKTWPIVRLNGNVVDFANQAQLTWPLSIASGETMELPLNLTLANPGTGEHRLQVYFLEDSLQRISAFPLRIRIEG